MIKSSNKIKVHYGMPDYYKLYLSKSEKKVSQKTFNDVISYFNENIIKLMLEENVEYLFPNMAMRIVTRKEKRKPKIVNGKLHNNIPIDWKTTKELWESDEEAKEKKIIVRYNNSHTSGFVFMIKLYRFGINYKNKRHYRFKASRNFARALAKRIKDEEKDKYDSYKLY